MSTAMAPSCVASAGASGLPPERGSDERSATAAATSSSMPSRTRLTMRRLARLPGGSEASIFSAAAPAASEPPSKRATNSARAPSEVL